MTESDLPTGAVTFLLTDIEGSTRLWQEHPEAMNEIVARHDELIGGSVAGHNGVLVKSKGEGDSTFSVFSRPTDAVAAAVSAQRALGAEPWPSGISVSVRAALHTGEAELRDGDYYGTAVNRCARLRAVAHGGQTICSQVTAELVADGLPEGVGIRSLGTHRLKDLERPEQVFQLSRADFPEEFPPLRSLDTFRHNLPTQRTSFVGRDDEIRVVRKHLDQNRIVTLTGVGGCGKTRLSLQVAAELLDDFADGVYFVELSPISDPDAVPTAIAVAIGLSSGGGATTGSSAPIRELLIDGLGDREVLIIFDNCEHLIDACAEMADDVLDACPKVKILATSREALEVDGEQTHTIASLEVPKEGDLGTSESVRLFIERASAVREGFGLTQDNSDSVAEICRRLDGIPLAIELAAAQVSHLAPEQIVRRLDDRFALLTGGRRRVQRQQTLQATLDWSHDLLSESERGFLRRLAVFPGSFTLEAAEATCGEGIVRPVEALRSLVSKSLVITEEGRELRYRLLETVRLYAEEKLLASGEAEGIRSRHRDHFLAWSEALDPEDVQFEAVLASEAHNLVAGLAWSERQDRLDLVGRQASVMNWWQADATDVLRWLTLGLEALDRLDPEQRVRVLVSRGWAGSMAADNTEPIRSFAQRAIEESDDRPGYWNSSAYSLLCHIRSFDAPLLRIDLREEVEGYARRALELSTGVGSRAMVLRCLGQARTNCGDFEGAIGAFDELRHLPIDTLIEYPSLSMLSHLIGRADEAYEYARLGCDAAPSFSAPDWRIWNPLAKVLALAGRGQHDEALVLSRELGREAAGSRVPALSVAVAAVFAAVAALRGDWERSSVLLGSVRACFDRTIVRSPLDIAIYAHYVPKVREALGPERARELRDRGYAMPIEEAVAYALESA